MSIKLKQFNSKALSLISPETNTSNIEFKYNDEKPPKINFGEMEIYRVFKADILDDPNSIVIQCVLNEKQVKFLHKIDERILKIMSKNKDINDAYLYFYSGITKIGDTPKEHVIDFILDKHGKFTLIDKPEKKLKPKEFGIKSKDGGNITVQCYFNMIVNGKIIIYVNKAKLDSSEESRSEEESGSEEESNNEDSDSE